MMLCLMTSSLSGSTTAWADDGTVCIQRSTAEECRRKVELFDELADEARAIRVQRDECSGRLREAREQADECGQSVRMLDTEVARLTVEVEGLEGRTSRLWWLVGGAALGVGTVLVVR